MQLTVHFINAFTSSVFSGNSAGVILLDKWLADGLMQAIAAENNLSETAFVVLNQDGVYHIRWFSPLSEIDFCGHATLASAFVLFEMLTTQRLHFFAKAVGKIAVKAKADGFIEMNFPSRPPEAITDVPEEIYAGLSIKPQEVLRNQQAYVAIFSDESEVKSLVANSEVLKKLAPYDVIATAASSSKHYDFVSRYFWPANGGDEDPVTGSAHAGLTPLWSSRMNKNELVAYQASLRGGYLLCRQAGERVFVSGQAVRYLTGTINL